ncbi:MAG: cytochrome c4 [Ramlibacter sp.]|jgi:cytochrome c553|nr:cytochrome c4 [Ramlibacter sp.]
MKIAAIIVLGCLWPPLACADAKAGEKKAQLCLLCHKAARDVTYEPLPLLEGQTREYLYNQIKAYKEKRRPDPTPLLVMQTNTANLSDADMRDIADYFASRKPMAVSYPVDSAAVSRGQALAESMKCASCHMANYSGKSKTPRLAGLNPRYLAVQLQGFVAGKRTHPVMSGVKQFPAADTQALAHYLGQLQ